MNIQEEHTAEGGRFFIEENGRMLAVMTYTTINPLLYRFEHTVVKEEMEGKGVGKALMERAVAWVRTEKARIIPQCPFVNAQMKRHPEWHDIQAEQ